jgi:hypothetical protein
MATKTLRISRKVEGVSLNADEVVLSDPTGTYGVRLLGSSEVHTDAGTVVPSLGNGQYAIGLTDLISGQVYEYVVKRTVGTSIRYVRGTFIAEESAGPVSIFHTYDEFLDRFGQKNVARASNKDSDDKQVNLPAVQQAFDYASEQINHFFLGFYVIPLDWEPNSGIVPMTVRSWAMSLAYDFLYEARGFLDVSSPVRSARGGFSGSKPDVRNKVSALAQSARNQMALYRGGLRELPAVRDTGAGREYLTVDFTFVLQIRDPDERPFILQGN